MKSVSSFFLISFAVLVVFLTAKEAFAGQNHNIFGHAWSHNTGWIKLNNCTESGGTISCPSSGPTYGVNVDPVTGDVSGYGWSSSVGWIDFDSTACGSAARVLWQSGTNSGGNASGFGTASTTGTWSGYIKALAGSGPNAGGWDGCIKMSGTIAGGGNYGVTIGPSGQFSGYAWNANQSGSVVVGDSWISFALARLVPTASDIELSVASWVQGACTSAGSNPLGLSWNVTNVIANSCTLAPIGATAQQGQGSLTHSPTQSGTSQFAVGRAPNHVYQLQCTASNNQPITRTASVSCNACSDGIDNDNDGLVDSADPRCNCSGSYSAGGTTESGGCAAQVLDGRGNPIYEER
jgi:hypothetical protein